MNEVTLGNVLVAAEIGRAPVVAESAGYVALAVADQLLRAPLSVDPASVGLSTEGAVVIEGARAASSSEAEASVRALLASLLSVSKGSTPALGAAARRPSGAGIEALVNELEGALIPVNRAAAKRAIARLARETTRARESGALRGRKPRKTVVAPPPRREVFEEAVPTRRAPGPEVPAMCIPTPPPMPVASPPPLLVDEPPQLVLDEPPTPILEVAHVAPAEVPQLELFVAEEEALDPASIEISRPIYFEDDEATPLDEVDGMTNRLPRSTYEHTLPLRFGEPPAELAALSVQPIIVVPSPARTPPPAPAASPEEIAAAAPPPPRPAPATHKEVLATQAPQSVDALLSTFEASSALPEHEVRNLLKRTAGLDPTALPPAVAEAAPETELAFASAPTPSAALAPADPTGDAQRESPEDERLHEVRLEPPRNPRAGMGIMFFLLLLALGGAVFAWVKFPWLFTGHRG